MLRSTLNGDSLARSLVNTQTATELGLVRSEVQRLRAKITVMEREKDNMVDNFQMTTQILLNRIKDLEAELSDSTSRPQTAVVIDRIEGRAPASSSRGHAPEVLHIETEGSDPKGAPEVREDGQSLEQQRATSDTFVCGNCNREIPAGNIVSHNTHCYKFNFRCAVCDEVLPIKDRERHTLSWTRPERLFAAAEAMDVDVLQACASHGADFAVTHGETSDTLLHVAARLGDVDLVTFFMGYGVEIDPVNTSGETPLHLATARAELCVVKLLYELGANLNSVDSQGESPLMIACRRGSSSLARYLVETKADVEACTKLGDTPVQLAQRLGHTETVLALGMAGAPLRPGTPHRVRSNSPAAVSGIGRKEGFHGGYPQDLPSNFRPPRPRKDHSSSKRTRSSSGRLAFAVM